MVRGGIGALAALTALVVAGCSEDRPQSLAEVAPAVGECFTPPDGRDPDDAVFAVVGCDAPHAGEVVARVALADVPATDGSYPGDEEVRVAAVDACVAPFETYVGIAYAQSRYTLQPIVPSAESWADGDRAVVCVVVQLGPATGGDGATGPATAQQQTVGSARGAGV
jgi:hypothetical protein